MNAEEIVKDHMRTHVRDFWEIVKLKADLGGSLRPSTLIPQGSACSPGESFDLSEAAMRARDRELAAGLLCQLESLRSEYPEIAEEFSSVLAKAEQVWNGCLAA